MHLPEQFLHFSWKFRLYGSQTLVGTKGELIRVIDPGFHHKNAGPDFFRARIMIDETEWVGNVEIHLKSSDWLLHQHHQDRAYDNVILHVVFEDDLPVFRSDATAMPVLELGNCIPKHYYSAYENLVSNLKQFPCQFQLPDVDPFFVASFLSRVGIERLQLKSEEVYEQLRHSKGDWDETFYHFMAKSFGFKINTLPMEMLASSLPQRILAKHKDQPLQVEALLFGQAGFLNQRFTEDYPKRLKSEYQFLKNKYQLKPLENSIWKFMRMRPQNFPTLRIAQFAALIVKSSHLFSKIMILRNDEELAQIFEALPVHSYWQTHYHFNKKADQVSLQLGKASIINLLINTVALFLFAYGNYIRQQVLIDRAFRLLERLPSEKNAILTPFLDSGMKIDTAFESQAALQLKKFYCNEKKCLNCGIGIKIIKR